MKKKRTSRKVKRNIFIAAMILVVIVAVMLCVLLHEGGSRGMSEANIHAVIARCAVKHNVPKALVMAVIKRESRFDPTRRGKAGEIGLMQIMPPGTRGAADEWARVYRTSPPARRQLFEVETNVNIGCWYLARAFHRWKGYKHGIELALVEYNAGPSQADKAKPATPDGKINIKIASTERYVADVMKFYQEFCESGEGNRYVGK